VSTDICKVTSLISLIEKVGFKKRQMKKTLKGTMFYDPAKRLSNVIDYANFVSQQVQSITVVCVCVYIYI